MLRDINRYIKLLTIVLMISGCENKKKSLGERKVEITSQQKSTHSQISKLKGVWKLECSHVARIEIDNGDEIVIYPLPEEVEVKTILVIEDGDGSIEDWGIEVSPLAENTVGGLSVCDKGIEAPGGHVDFVFRTIENGFILDVFMIVDYTKHSLVWKHVATYTKITVGGQ